jgi:hypothetical protein
MNIEAIFASIFANQDKASLVDLTTEDTNDSTSWKNIPRISQDLSIKATSVSDAAFPSQPCEMFLTLIKNKRAVMTRTIANVLLSNMGCQMDMSTLLAAAIACANFQSISLQTSHAFSIFCMPYHDPCNTRFSANVALQLMASDGLGLDQKTAEKIA